MGYTFSKEPKRIIIGKKDEDIRKNAAANAVLRKLRRFLDTKEPELVYFLVNLWQNQGRAITFKELREAILAGDLTLEYLEEWRQDYSKFVVEHLQPAWQEAMKAAVEELEKKYPEWYFNPMAEGILEWTEARGAEFVTSVTENQMMGLRAVVQQAAVMNQLNVDQLARAIRGMVGLYEAQARANLRYYETLIKNGTSEKRAIDLSIRYGARQQRYRAMMISRQELAMAYNTGADQAVRQAIAAGYMKDAVKVFCCAEDERVCPTCGSLEGKVVGMNESFKVANRGRYRFTNLYPPVHIQCRCTVIYKPVE